MKTCEIRVDDFTTIGLPDKNVIPVLGNIPEGFDMVALSRDNLLKLIADSKSDDKAETLAVNLINLLDQVKGTVGFNLNSYNNLLKDEIEDIQFTLDCYQLVKDSEIKPVFTP